MHWFVYHVASGQIFFSGVALIIAAALLSMRSTPLTRRAAVWAVLVGGIAVAISSTAIPYWYYALAIVVTLAWLLSGFAPQQRRRAQLAVVAVWAIAAAIEIPYLFVPRLVPAAARTFTVIGDSVTAGMSPDDEATRWPALLAREHNLQVQDLSHPGETAASALKRAQGKPLDAAVVLIEIGGNDLLGSTSSAQFSRDLDALLAHVCAPGRQVIMFELPLPPFRNEFGRIQRGVARKHGVALAPKRIFLSILAPADSTLDTIHLTPLGHRRMATSVWELVGSAFPASVESKTARELPIAAAGE